LLVSILSIAVNIALAVLLASPLAVLLFVLRMSRSNVRRLYRGDTVRSRKARGSGEMTILEAKGSSILVLELEGALFFSSADRLARMIEVKAADGGRCTEGAAQLIARMLRNRPGRADYFVGLVFWQNGKPKAEAVTSPFDPGYRWYIPRLEPFQPLTSPRRLGGAFLCSLCLPVLRGTTTIFVGTYLYPMTIGGQRQSAAETEEKVADRLVPTAVTVAMITTEISAAIRPYSIAVAPFSSCITLERIANMLATPNEDPLEFTRDRLGQSR
jgi:hypothetical protein